MKDDSLMLEDKSYFGKLHKLDTAYFQFEIESLVDENFKLSKVATACFDDFASLYYVLSRPEFTLQYLTLILFSIYSGVQLIVNLLYNNNQPVVHYKNSCSKY